MRSWSFFQGEEFLADVDDPLDVASAGCIGSLVREDGFELALVAVDHEAVQASVPPFVGHVCRGSCGPLKVDLAMGEGRALA